MVAKGRQLTTDRPSDGVSSSMDSPAEIKINVYTKPQNMVQQAVFELITKLLQL